MSPVSASPVTPFHLLQSLMKSNEEMKAIISSRVPVTYKHHLGKAKSLRTQGFNSIFPRLGWERFAQRQGSTPNDIQDGATRVFAEEKKDEASKSCQRSDCRPTTSRLPSSSSINLLTPVQKRPSVDKPKAKARKGTTTRQVRFLTPITSVVKTCFIL